MIAGGIFFVSVFFLPSSSPILFIDVQIVDSKGEVVQNARGGGNWGNTMGTTLNVTCGGGGGLGSTLMGNRGGAEEVHKVCKAPYRGSTPEFRSPEIEELQELLKQNVDMTQEEWEASGKNLLEPSTSDAWAWGVTVFYLFHGGDNLDLHKQGQGFEALQSLKRYTSTLIVQPGSDIWAQIATGLSHAIKDSEKAAACLGGMQQHAQQSGKESLLRKDTLVDIGLKMGAQKKIKRFIHAAVHPIPPRLVSILERVLHADKGERYLTMKDIIADLKELDHMSRFNPTLEMEGLLPTSPKTGKQIHWYLGCSLLNKGFVAEAKKAFEAAGDEAPVASTIIDRCQECWAGIPHVPSKSHRTIESSSSTSGEERKPIVDERRRGSGVEIRSDNPSWTNDVAGTDYLHFRHKIKECPDRNVCATDQIENYVDQIAQVLDSPSSLMKEKGLAVLWCLTRCNEEQFEIFENLSCCHTCLEMLKKEALNITSGSLNARLVGFASAIIVDYLFLQFFKAEEFSKFCTIFIKKGRLDVAARVMAYTESDEVCQFNFVTIFWRFIDYCLDSGLDYRRTMLDNTDKLLATVENAKHAWPYNVTLNARADQVLKLLSSSKPGL
jgi:hypothetical protein